MCMGSYTVGETELRTQGAFTVTQELNSQIIKIKGKIHPYTMLTLEQVVYTKQLRKTRCSDTRLHQQN